MRERDFFFDNAKFFLIILVVLGHSFELTLNRPWVLALYRLIYIFHMPAFIFICGYFAKSNKRPKIGYLFILYIFFQVLFTYYNNLLVNGEVHWLGVNFAIPFHVLWFLIALIVWRMVTPYVSTYNPLIVIPFTVFVALLAGFDVSLGYVASLSRIIVLFPFFLLGRFADKKYIEKFKRPFMYATACLLFAGSFLVLRFAFHGDAFTTLLYHSTAYSAAGFSPWTGFLIRLGIFIWAFVSGLAFFIFIPERRLPIINVLGEGTLLVFLVHDFFILFFKRFNITQNFNAPQMFLFFAGVVAFTVVLLSLTFLSKRNKVN